MGSVSLSLSFFRSLVSFLKHLSGVNDVVDLSRCCSILSNGRTGFCCQGLFPDDSRFWALSKPFKEKDVSLVVIRLCESLQKVSMDSSYHDLMSVQRFLRNASRRLLIWVVSGFIPEMGWTLGRACVLSQMLNINCLMKSLIGKPFYSLTMVFSNHFSPIGIWNLCSLKSLDPIRGMLVCGSSFKGTSSTLYAIYGIDYVASGKTILVVGDGFIEKDFLKGIFGFQSPLPVWDGVLEIWMCKPS